MKTLYLDLSKGAAGDMLTAALYELLDDNQKKEFSEKVNSLGIDGVEVIIKNTVKYGVSGTSVDVIINGVIEGEDHHQDHHHEHHHEHRSMDDVMNIINSLNVSDDVKKNAKKIYGEIADAESVAHAVPVTEVHFHEVGAVDAIVDVTAVCVLMEMLAPDKVYATPVCVGYGTVECAHGILPVPAPATANILKDLPTYPGDTEGEMCTPTGAAVLRSFVDEFGPLPKIESSIKGYGIGKRDYGVSSALNAFLATD